MTLKECLERTASAVRDVGADWVVLSSFDAVCYATGHVTAIEAGPSPFAGGPTLALIGRNGTSGLVCPNIEARSAELTDVDFVAIYEGYTFDHAVDHVDAYRAAVESARNMLGASGRIASERGSLPHHLAELLGVDPVLDITPSLRRARATKTVSELGLLMRCAEAVAIGQRRFLETVRPGVSELAVFAEIRCAIEEFAGARVPITGDFISGRERTAAFTGWPIDRVIAAGEPVMADLAPRIDGYWGDCCGTTCVGQPSAGFTKLFATSTAALEHALGFIRPGRTAAEVDAELRAFVGRHGFAYPHHSGHSIGTAVHEFPRLVPYETATLEPDMVLLVEPGCYDPEIGGVRSEFMIRVTRDGCEPLCRFEHRLNVEVAP